MAAGAVGLALAFVVAAHVREARLGASTPPRPASLRAGLRESLLREDASLRDSLRGRMPRPASFACGGGGESSRRDSRGRV